MFLAGLCRMKTETQSHGTAALNIGPTGLATDGLGNLYVGDGGSIWQIATVPEPGTILLLDIGLLGMLIPRSR